MKAVRTSIAAGLAWGVVLACACGGSNTLFSQGDAGSDTSSSSSSGSSSGGGSGGSSSGGGSGSSSGSSSGSASSSGSSSGGETCGACATNEQCAGCVSPPEGSSNCCQAGVGFCYVVPSPTCPGSSSSSGGGSGSSSGGSSGGSSGSSSGGTTCGSCSSDLQCQLTCPPVQGGGTNCCEVSAGICYAVAGNTCPVPADASTE